VANCYNLSMKLATSPLSKPMVAPVPGIRCRQIADADVPAVAALLARGFPGRNRQYWEGGLQQLGKLQPPPGLPKYGYLLDAAGTVVGTLLLISSTRRAGNKLITRSNVSSWYVEPDFRAYAPLLTLRAHAHKDVTYLNVSPDPSTWSIIEAQGFLRYCDGTFITFPILKGVFGDGESVQVLDGCMPPAATFEPFEREILLRHAEFGCISLWCVTSERAYPFVFQPWRSKKIIPSARLIYCRDIGDFVRFAGPIGRVLARRGRSFVVVDANGAVPGLLGIFRGNRPKYYRGPDRPRLGDLAYTESVVFGI
jgi:hypothetical protein